MRISTGRPPAVVRLLPITRNIVPPGRSSENVCRMTSRMSKKYFDSSAGRLRRRKPASPPAFSRSMRWITPRTLRGSSDLFAAKNFQ